MFFTISSSLQCLLFSHPLFVASAWIPLGINFPRKYTGSKKKLNSANSLRYVLRMYAFEQRKWKSVFSLCNWLFFLPAYSTTWTTDQFELWSCKPRSFSLFFGFDAKLKYFLTFAVQWKKKLYSQYTFRCAKTVSTYLPFNSNRYVHQPRALSPTDKAPRLACI